MENDILKRINESPDEFISKRDKERMTVLFGKEYANKKEYIDACSFIKSKEDEIELFVKELFDIVKKKLTEKEFSYILYGTIGDEKSKKFIINNHYKLVLLNNESGDVFHDIIIKALDSLVEDIIKDVDPSTHGLLFFSDDTRNHTFVTKMQYYDPVDGIAIYITGDVSSSGSPFMCISMNCVVMKKKNQT